MLHKKHGTVGYLNVYVGKKKEEEYSYGMILQVI